MPAPDLRRRLDVLVERRQLTPGQADAVAAHLAAATDRGGGVPVVVEAVGYLGAALAAAALLLLIDHLWALLEVWAQTSALALVAAALWLGGRWVRTPPASPQADRVAGVLWLLAAVAATGAAGVVVDAAEVAGELQPLLVGGAAVGVSAPLWWARPKALQLLALFAAVLTTACGALLWADVDAGWAWGLLVTCLGLAWMLLTVGGLLAPVRAGLVLGAVAALVGPQLMAFDLQVLGPLAGLGVAVGLLAASVATRQAALAGLGTVAATGYLLQLTSRLFPGELAWTVGLLIAGVTLLAGALATLRLAREQRSGVVGLER